MISKGYTLLELMVVVAIVGIISAIAYPSYQGYLRDTYQAQALADLQICTSALERWYTNDFTYEGANDNGVCTLWSPSDQAEADKKFTLTYETLNANTYVVRATPVDDDLQCIQVSADGTQSQC